MNLAQMLVRAARIHPDRPALFHGEQLVCDYRELAGNAARVAGYLSCALGLRPGDRVALFMNNNLKYLEILYGAWFAGLAVVPLNAKLHAREAHYILEDSGASVLFISEELESGLAPSLASLPALRAVLTPGTTGYRKLLAAEPVAAAHRQPDDLAWLFYTSGTTGQPKGVIQTHRMLYAMTACYFMDCDTTALEDTAVYAAPMSHAAGMGNFPHMCRAAAHCIPESGGFEPAELLALAARRKNLSLFAAPTMVKRLVDEVEASGADASGFKTILYGGGPMYAEDIRRALRVIGNRFVQVYGQGESPMTITALSRRHLADSRHPRYAQRIASVGTAQSLVEVRVADENGRTLPNGEVGEILVFGDAVMPGYWNNPEATKKALRDGWLLTGDIGAFDDDGFLTLRDRSKDVIISGGSNIYPREVEEALLTHTAVGEVAVIGRPSAEWGEEVVAFVVLRPGQRVEERQLDAVCLDRIARFKRPKAYRFIEALPKNHYGKVLKTCLRERLNAEPARDAVA